MVACKFPTNGELRVNQDIKLYLARLSTGETLELPIEKNRHGWLQVISGSLGFENQNLQEGDGIAFDNLQNPAITVKEEIEILFFDLP